MQIGEVPQTMPLAGGMPQFPPGGVAPQASPGFVPQSSAKPDQDKLKNVYERKMFDKRVGKITGDKTEKGEREFKAWLFDVRKVTAEDGPSHLFLDWIANLEGYEPGLW